MCGESSTPRHRHPISLKGRPAGKGPATHTSVPATTLLDLDVHLPVPVPVLHQQRLHVLETGRAVHASIAIKSKPRHVQIHLKLCECARIGISGRAHPKARLWRERLDVLVRSGI